MGIKTNVFVEDLQEAFILLLSGAAEMKNKNEMWWTDKLKRRITLEFVDGSYDHNIVRNYYNNKRIHWQNEFQNDELTCSDGWYYEKCHWWHEEYKGNKKNGRCTAWGPRGGLLSDEEWRNGVLIKDIKKENKTKGKKK